MATTSAAGSDPPAAAIISAVGTIVAIATPMFASDTSAGPRARSIACAGGEDGGGTAAVVAGGVAFSDR